MFYELTLAFMCDQFLYYSDSVNFMAGTLEILY